MEAGVSNQCLDFVLWECRLVLRDKSSFALVRTAIQAQSKNHAQLQTPLFWLTSGGRITIKSPHLLLDFRLLLIMFSAYQRHSKQTSASSVKKARSGPGAKIGRGGGEWVCGYHVLIFTPFFFPSRAPGPPTP